MQTWLGCLSGQQGALHRDASASTFFKGKHEVSRWPKQSGGSVTILKQLLQVVLYLEIITEKLLLLNKMEYIKGIFAMAYVMLEIIQKSYTWVECGSGKQMLFNGIELSLTIHLKIRKERAGKESAQR